MRTVRRLLWRDTVWSVTFVAIAFLSLFFFIDVVEDLDQVGRRGRTLGHVALAAVYEIPGHLYDLMPIAVLIGTIYALARLAQSSEYTILRTSGLGPWCALRLLALLGVFFGLFTLFIGDVVAPASERALTQLQARFSGGFSVGGTGAWLKERRATPQGEHSLSINVGRTSGAGQLSDVLIFEFDADGRLLQRIGAKRAQVESDELWTLFDVIVTHWPAPGDSGHAPVREESHATLRWTTTLSADVVAAAILPLTTMTTLDLYRYSAHLSDQEQAAQRHQIRFWRKALYPAACLVMVALALPFAYQHARAGGISLKVFGGIMLGVAFVLLNNLAGHIAVLRDWTPWVAASAPSALFLLLSMAAFAWLVRYR